MRENVDSSPFPGLGPAPRRGRPGLGLLGEERGQAVVEAAIILPAMVFLILCILQLTLLQQARIMVEYAAFTAARAGVVHNMNNGLDGGDPTGVMRNAAVYSILPTYGRTDSITAITAAKAAYEAEDSGMRAAGLPMVKVAVLNPTRGNFSALGGHLNGQEIDFDDMRPAATSATLLSIQVRYLFELRVPFANKMLEAIWLAAQAGTLSSWKGFNMASPGKANDSSGEAVNASLTGGILTDGTPGGLNLAALGDKAKGGRFFLPVNAWFTMRMQSNPFLQWAQ